MDIETNPTHIATLNKVRLNLLKENQGNDATRAKSMAITKIDEAIQWLMKPHTDLIVDEMARENAGPIVGESI